MNLDEHNKALVSEQTVSKVQAQLEGKVQQLLDELTVLVNNKYSKGKHTYDYQLVRLTEGQIKEEHEALDKADEIYFKHSQLKKQEMEMDKKFEGTEATLKMYKQSFDKQKKSLQQDHDTYVSIKEKTEKDLKDAMALQQQTEIGVSEALNEKLAIHLKAPKPTDKQEAKAKQESEEKKVKEEKAKKETEEKKQKELKKK